MMKRIVAICAAVGLLGIAGCIGYQALNLMFIQHPAVHYQAAELQMSLDSYAEILFHQALLRALLAIAAVIPVPALLRIAAER